jgi:hypothetical protein
MYRELLALSIQRERPNFEVLLAAPEDLDEEEVERLAPHAIVQDDDGVERWFIDGVVCWAGIIDDNLNARISVDGRISEIHDVSLEEFIAALDEAERLISVNKG